MSGDDGGVAADEWGMTAGERGFTLTIAEAGPCGLVVDWASEPAAAPSAAAPPTAPFGRACRSMLRPCCGRESDSSIAEPAWNRHLF